MDIVPRPLHYVKLNLGTKERGITMNQAIINNFKAIMEKYDKNYDTQGIKANLNEWDDNKRGLTNLLRKHPNWNEDELAIVFEVDIQREINREFIRIRKDEICVFCRDLDIDENARRNAFKVLTYITDMATSAMSCEWVVQEVIERTGIKCVMGQKTSRVFNSICKKFGLDKHPDYPAKFASYADAMNPVSIKKKCTLSVNPCDFLEMSNGSSWQSCHRLNGGDCQAGTLSYMNDGVSMIFSTFNDEVEKEYYKTPKQTRQVFAYGNGILLQSRLYPYTDDEVARDTYRKVVQKAIADCLDVPNLWVLKKDQNDVSNRIETHEDAHHYEDYSYNYKANISLLKALKIFDDDTIQVGYTSYCVDCGNQLEESDEIVCSDCNGSRYTCAACGCSLDEDDGHWIDGELYCDDCCHYCDHCHEYTTEDTTMAHNRRGFEEWVCPDCLDSYYCYCETCGEYYHTDTGNWIDGEYYCDDCTEERFECCNDCGEYVDKDDIVGIEDGCYCESCAEEHKHEEDSEEIAKGA